MKKIFPIFLLTFFLAAPFAAHADITDGLVGWWKLDDGSGTTAADSSGNGNTGTLVNSPTWTTGVINGGLQFNGSNSYVSTLYTVPAQTSTTTFTWSAWVNLNVGNSSTLVILGFRNGATWLKLTPSSLEYSAGSIISYSIPTTSWVLLTIVKNGSSFTYYSNGAVVGTTTNSASVVSHQFFMGEDPGFPSDGDLSGTLDDVRVYNRALSAADVAQLYAYAGTGKMNSSNYSITIDSINFTGNYSTSTSYSMQDTGGEIGSGNSSSTNYLMSAGYQQMYTSYISIGSLSPVTMSNLSGLSGAPATGTIPVTVTTDNPAGYSLSVQATSSPAMKSVSGAYFSDYSPTGASPDFAFAVPAASSTFGFSVLSADATARYKNNGSACNTGSSNTSFTCWDGFSTTSKTIAQSIGPNYPSGTVTTLGLQAQVGSSKIQDSGTYTATLTITAVTL